MREQINSKNRVMLENLGRRLGNIQSFMEGTVDKAGKAIKNKISNVGRSSLPETTEIEMMEPVSLSSTGKIKGRQNWRLDGKSLAEMWVKRFGDPKKIAEALTDLIGPEGDVRFKGKFKNMEIDAEQLNLALKILSQMPNRTHSRIRAILTKIFPFFNKGAKTKAIKKKLTLDLVGLLTRKPVDAKYDNGSNTLTQTNGHVKKEGDVYVLVSDRAISADVQNLESDVDNAANLGTIRDDSGEVILARSCRTDNPGKVEQKSVFDIISRFQAAKKGSTPTGMVERKVVKRDTRGFPRKDSRGDQITHTVYEYRRTDVTFMDDSFIKAAGTTLKTLWRMIKTKSLKPIESEQKFFNAKLATIDNLWSKKGGATWDDEKKEYYIEREIQVEGRTETVREYKPIVLNHVMSVLVKKAKKTAFINYTQLARKQNIESHLAMLRIMTERNKALKAYFTSTNTYPQGQEILDCINNPTKENRARLVELLRNVPQNIPSATAQEYQDLKTGLDCLIMCLTGKDEFGKSIDNAQGSALQFIATSILAKLADLPIGVECKSGNDRTATGMAIICAQKEFRDTQGKFFIPGRDPVDDKAFANLFKKYIEKFAQPNVLASRGIKEGDEKPVLKCNKSPVFWEIVRPIIPEDKFNDEKKRVAFIRAQWNVKLE